GLRRAKAMDALVALGTSMAWLFGAIEFLSPDTLVPGRQQYYFEVSALVLGFLLVGRLLEQRMSRQASGEVQRLMELQPRTARVEEDGKEREVPVASVQAGDVVAVRPGERITVDGLVLDGQSAVDEKLITGESLPVDKGPGDPVIGGSVNRGGLLRIQCTHVGEESALAGIVQLIEHAQEQAPEVQRYADRISAWVVPCVIAVALLSFGCWWLLLGQTLSFAFSVFVAVLLIASPAAVGLATPSVLVTAVAKGTRQGMLIKGAEFLERVQQVDVVIFDKTGTVTMGEPALTDVHAFHGSEDELLAQAAAAELDSEHPLGRTLVRAARERGCALAKPAKGRVFSGAGVEAHVHGEDVLVGTAVLMKDRRIDTRPAEALVERLRAQGKTVVLVARGPKLAGVLAFADPVKPEAKEAVQRLQAQGVEVALVTGDNVRTAEAIAGELGIQRIFADITPHGKAGVVKAFQDGDHVVAMVGDGINDAPALAQADVGIAIGSGSEVALEAADLVLMRSDPRDVGEAMSLSRATFLKIRGNLRWAFAYNLVLVPIAALGLLNPLLAGLAMACSSVPVLANARKTAREWALEDAPRPDRGALAVTSVLK
ncbi:MAG: copper-translocating P-type ATPase, partial [Halobacteriales archaeon]|nr:copper-translocating P-type ATPase [Halobacteriales archaeon]